MSDTANFVPGKELARRLAQELIPRLRDFFPETPITLALLGPGSDVLGFDTRRSMDHDWGPGVTLLVPHNRLAFVRCGFAEHVDQLLPAEISGFPTRYSRHSDGTAEVDAKGIEHRVRITSEPELLQSTLLINSMSEVTDEVWLSTPMQILLELTAGEVFVDDAGDLTTMRRRLEFYPDHIWRYQLASFWMRIAQVQPFVGRCFEAGDSTGAATIAIGMVRDLSRIGLLQSRQYVPYPKWLGTALAQSEIGKTIGPDLAAASNCSNFQLLEHSINSAGTKLIQQLNGLDLVPAFDPHAFQYWNRPFMVLPAEEIALALKESVRKSGLAHIEGIIGGINALSDSTDALSSRAFRLALRTMYTVR